MEGCTMLSAELLREQVAAVMAMLSKTAVMEISKIIDCSFAEMCRELSLRQSELEVLRTKVRSLTGKGRAYAEWNNFDSNINITPPRRSIAVQVSFEQEVAESECSTSLDPRRVQCPDVMEVIVKVEEGDEKGNQETLTVNQGQSESSSEPHAGLTWANQLRAPAGPLYRHSSALLPAAFGPVQREEGRPRGKDSHRDIAVPFTNTHLTQPQDSTSVLTHNQMESLGLGELQLELKVEQVEEKLTQKFHAIPSCSSPLPTFSSPPDLMLPLSSSTSSESSFSSSTSTLTPRTAQAAVAATEMPTQASVSPPLLHCASCPKTFSQKSALKQHERSHSDARLFYCNDCGKSFSLRANLQRHKLLHSGSKPFACQYCGKCFNHPSNMKTHLRIHTGERPYLCLTCGQTFNQHTNLTRHQKRWHPELYGGSTTK